MHLHTELILLQVTRMFLPLAVAGTITEKRKRSREIFVSGALLEFHIIRLASLDAKANADNLKYEKLKENVNFFR